MIGRSKLMYSPSLFDGMFAGSGTLAVIGIVLSTSRAYPAITPASQPLLKGTAILGALVVASLIAMISVRRDQKRADDFLYQTLCKSAFVAIFTLFFGLLLWRVLFVPSLGDVSTHTVIGMLVASWSIAYFYTRVRGTGL